GSARLSTRTSGRTATDRVNRCIEPGPRRNERASSRRSMIACANTPAAAPPARVMASATTSQDPIAAISRTAGEEEAPCSRRPSRPKVRRKRASSEALRPGAATGGRSVDWSAKRKDLQDPRREDEGQRDEERDRHDVERTDGIPARGHVGHADEESGDEDEEQQEHEDPGGSRGQRLTRGLRQRVDDEGRDGRRNGPVA